MPSQRSSFFFVHLAPYVPMASRVIPRYVRPFKVFSVSNVESRIWRRNATAMAVPTSSSPEEMIYDIEV